MQITITPIGDIDTTVIGEAADILRKQYDANVNVTDEASYSRLRIDPQSPPYEAKQILSVASEYETPDPLVLITRLPITHADRAFVFGVADAERSACLVSTYLLFQSTDGNTLADPGTALSRVRTEVGHEVGHVFGQSHCSNSNCVMSFSMNLQDIDAKSELLCESCAQA